VSNQQPALRWVECWATRLEKRKGKHVAMVVGGLIGCMGEYCCGNHEPANSCYCSFILRGFLAAL